MAASATPHDEKHVHGNRMMLNKINKNPADRKIRVIPSLKVATRKPLGHQTPDPDWVFKENTQRCPYCLGALITG